MGMYTQFHFGARLQKDTPDPVLRILRYMVGDVTSEQPERLPDHEFFECERWRMLFTCDSYYFNYKTEARLIEDTIIESHFLCVTSNLKNYGGEIDEFLDWIMPYVDAFEGDFLGYKRYEQTEQPTIIYKPSPGIIQSTGHLVTTESTTQTDALAIPDSSSAAQSTAAEGEQQGGSK